MPKNPPVETWQAAENTIKQIIQVIKHNMTQPKEQIEKFARKHDLPFCDVEQFFEEALKEGFNLCKERVREGLPTPHPLCCEDCEGSKQTCELFGKGFNASLFQVKTLIDNLEI